MPNTIGFQLSIGNLPEGWEGSPQDLLDAVAQLLQVKFEEDFALFKIGPTQPDSNQNRAWLKDGTAWWVFDETIGDWRPADISDKYRLIYVQPSDPSATDTISNGSLWLRLESNGVTPRSMSVWIDGSWRILFDSGELNALTTRVGSVIKPGGGLLDNSVSLVNIQTSAVEAIRKVVLNSTYPIGTIYENTSNSASPASLMSWPESSWQKVGEGRVIVGEGTGAGLTARIAGQTGGVEEVTLTGAQSGVRSHSHRVYGLTGTGGGFDRTERWGSVARGETTVAAGSEPAPKDYVQQNSNNRDIIESAQQQDATTAHTNMQPFLVAFRWVRIG